MLENEYLKQRSMTIGDITLLHNQSIIHNFDKPLSDFLFKDVENTETQSDQGDQVSDVDVTFQLCSLVFVTTPNNRQTLQFPIKNDLIPIKNLIDFTREKYVMNERDKCNLTTILMEILDENAVLSEINAKKYILLKENETCFVTVETKDAGNNVQKMVSRTATIANTRQMFQILLDQNLISQDDFIPTEETALSTLLFPNTTLITFTVDNLTCERICEIGFVALREDATLYDLCLKTVVLDKSLTLNKINEANESMVIGDENEFQLVCVAQTKCVVTLMLDDHHEHNVVELFCDSITPIKYLFETGFYKVEQHHSSQEEQSDFAMYYEHIATDLDLTVHNFSDALPVERAPLGDILHFTIKKTNQYRSFLETS
ncbi:unnamed protein product [Didymodactylos carnosus]|uniref:Uncharacterized protein n=1 Tax=Didymodactylos carnosus TaxID=1234261 RepID=A0A815VMR4_9BILA|nr:unnamed protein product [Didymodactylos carnosus]CAF1537775.1 unnamed protein product [Didymodactylos carnosus]CAF4245814.1 unnamed protein product [Didymodactylos carnosus]CAF4397764.1 unnamed protein product [Didymodactylos carnosus]